MNFGNCPCDSDAAFINNLVNGGNPASDNDAAIASDLVDGGNSASNSDATIVNENSVNSDNVMIGDDVEDVVVDKYHK